MTDTLTILKRPDKIDTKGWDIKFSQLLAPKRGAYPYHFLRDELHESFDKKYACLFYTINEYRMGSEAGLLGIFENKSNPLLLVNPKNQWFDYQGDRSLIFSDNFLFVRKLVYNSNYRLSGTPFVIFDLSKKTFGFIDFDATSIYYSTVKVKGTIYEFHLDTPEELKHTQSATRHKQTFDLATIKFHSFDMLDEMIELYFDEKKNGC